ncbi:MAG: hypothetical protein WDO73_08055 [Ignavibacteriota bacterium]
MLLVLVVGGSMLVYYGIHSRTVSANTLVAQDPARIRWCRCL